MNIQEIIASAKVACLDSKLIDVPDVLYPIIQPKYDGWWALIECLGHTGKIYSSGGKEIGELAFEEVLFGEVYYFVGEFMYGTNWAQTNNPGTVFIHDIWQGTVDDPSVRGYSYQRRYEICDSLVTWFDHPKLKMVPSKRGSITGAWDHYINDLGFEGLVFKNPTATYGVHHLRTKKYVTIDMVIMSVTEGGGRLKGKAGAIVCQAKRSNGVLVTVSVGGGMSDWLRGEIWLHPEQYIGKVVEIGGNELYECSIRHPNLCRFRPDKTPEQCVIPDIIRY